MQMLDDDDELEEVGVYENGHWKWNDEINGLFFMSDLVETKEDFVLEPKVCGPIEFKDDVDVMEQVEKHELITQRFRKRFQRKPPHGVEDFVLLQDVKDIVLFTAPHAVVTPAIVNILHLPVTERFLRALILFTQYYLQITDTMAMRTMELEIKVPTPDSQIVEGQYRENLQDLRLLVAKEYSTIIHGGEGTGKYHHMGKSKKSKSLSRKDAILVETLFRISIQIVWIALGRKSFNLIEVEINRIFKSETYNSVEHKLHTNYIQGMSPAEKMVLLGYSHMTVQKLCVKSPLMKEVVRHDTDYRMFGLGVVKYPHLTTRLRYMERAISAPEELLQEMGMTIGIIGMPRARFDTMLVEIKATTTTGSQTTSRGSLATRSRLSQASKAQQQQGKSANTALYPEIILPSKPEPREGEEEGVLEKVFPLESVPVRHCSQVQRKRWLDRTRRIAGKASNARKRTV